MKRLLPFLMLIGFASPCFAKAHYAPKKEMIQNAECIVIVEITKVDKSEKKGATWTYRQKALATVKQCLKGKAKGAIEIYGMETFSCGRCRYEKGNFILFLQKEEGFWAGSNWGLGIRPITDDKTQWFKDDETLEMKETPLDDVTKEINAVIEAQKKTPNKPDAGDGKSQHRKIRRNSDVQARPLAVAGLLMYGAAVLVFAMAGGWFCWQNHKESVEKQKQQKAASAKAIQLLREAEEQANAKEDRKKAETDAKNEEENVKAQKAAEAAKVEAEAERLR